MNPNSLARFALLALVVLALARAGESVTCNPIQLSPCAMAMSGSAPPSATCCARLRDQTPCLCQYYRDPNLSQYVNSPGAKRMVTSCGVSVQC